MNKLILLLSSVALSSGSYAEDSAAPVELDAPAPVDAKVVDTNAPGGDDISNPSPDVPEKAEDAQVQDVPAPEKPATTDEKFDMALSNIRATHPEKAKEFEAAYHASKDKESILAKWSNTTIESQDMLDAVDELYAIYQVLKNVSPELSIDFEKKVQDETDPRNLLEYAHQLLLKSLKDRKAQIEEAKEELTAVTTILQYVDINAARDVFKEEQTAEDPRTRVSEAYDRLMESLEKAHKEAGVVPLS